MDEFNQWLQHELDKIAIDRILDEAERYDEDEFATTDWDSYERSENDYWSRNYPDSPLPYPHHNT